MKQVGLTLALALAIFPVQSFAGCGGGGRASSEQSVASLYSDVVGSLSQSAENTNQSQMAGLFSTKNVYDIGAHAINSGNSAIGNGMGVLNGMMFDLVDFFSVQQNVDDFSAGRAALEGSAKSDLKGSAAHYGRSVGFTEQELSDLGLEN